MAQRDKSSSSAAISEEVMSKFKAIVVLTDAFCKRYLNEEYVKMCRRLALALVRKRPTPITRGRAEVWACGIVRTIGWANVLDAPSKSPYMKLIDIDPKFGVANSTGQGKCMAIKRMFGIGRLNVDWTLPSRLGDNPVVWKVWVNDELVDIRQESREQQEKAFRKGLIPWIPADREAPKAEDADKPSFALAEEDICEALAGFQRRVVSMLRKSSLDEGTAKVLSRHVKLVIQNITDEMQSSRDFDLAGRLESAYEEMRCLADDLS